MRQIVFHVGLFRNERERARSERALHAFLFALCYIDAQELKDNPQLPPLYRSGVRYQAERDGKEDWQDTLSLYRSRRGDCEDIACARVAELRVRYGIPAKPTIRYKKRGGFSLYHILVEIPGYRLEDPSRVLGMP